jgi:hypothetical protein
MPRTMGYRYALLLAALVLGYQPQRAVSLALDSLTAATRFDTFAANIVGASKCAECAA